MTHHQIATIPSRYKGEGPCVPATTTFTWAGATNSRNGLVYRDGQEKPFNIPLPNGMVAMTTGVPHMAAYGHPAVITAETLPEQADPIVLRHGDTIELDDGNWFAVRIRDEIGVVSAKFEPLGKVQSEPVYPQY